MLTAGDRTAGYLASGNMSSCADRAVAQPGSEIRSACREAAEAMAGEAGYLTSLETEIRRWALLMPIWDHDQSLLPKA